MELSVIREPITTQGYPITYIVIALQSRMNEQVDGPRGGVPPDRTPILHHM
jgi:hypothetical protein